MESRLFHACKSSKVARRRVKKSTNVSKIGWQQKGFSNCSKFSIWKNLLVLAGLIVAFKGVEPEICVSLQWYMFLPRVQ